MAEVRGYVGLSFDDGPNPSTTMPLLDALRASGTRATFFIWGEHAAANPELLHAVWSAGMWLANHTYTHPHLTQLDASSTVQEINQTQAIIRHVTGFTPAFFRPPYGQTSAQVRDRAARLGLTEVLWTVDTRDCASAAEIVAAAATVQPGGIILMHDNGFEETVLAVPEILGTLARRGLRPGRIVPATFGGAIAVAP